MFENLRRGRRGLERAIFDGLYGFVLIAVISAFIKALEAFTYQYAIVFVILFYLIEVILSISGMLDVLKMKYWGSVYLVFWLLGMGIMYAVNVVDILTFIFYLICGITLLVFRFLKKIEKLRIDE
ncbi:MAG TPA: hypothetical protein VK487_00170 [Candidatus Bathyarchaeia archaeon]|nr:hypothetical protein [Candidatus Bathyarchaeia archaeon]